MAILDEQLAPHQLTVLTTSACNAKCAHCSVWASPDRADTLSAAQIIEAIEAAHAENPVGFVIFAGGEPTLLGDELFDAISHVDCLGIGTRMVSNASWAKDPDSAAAMIRALREAGLAELNVSADDFHLPYIPLANVVNAWHASKGAGFMSVVVALCSGPRSKLTPEVLMDALGERVPLVYDEDGNAGELPEPSADGTRYLIANNNIYRIGRGHRLRSTVARIPATQDVLDRPCHWAVRSAAVSPRHHLVACCGIEAEGNEVLDFGELGEETVSALVAKANDDPLIAAIATLGPAHLMRKAAELDPSLPFRPDYAAICEICEDVTSNPRAVALLRERADELRAEVVARRAVNVLVDAAASART
jgi:hypothetical protein